MNQENQQPFLHSADEEELNIKEISEIIDFGIK